MGLLKQVPQTRLKPHHPTSTVAGILIASFDTTGARLKLDPWDGDIFTVELVSEGRFAATAAKSLPKPFGFTQFQIDEAGKLDHFSL